MRRTDRSDFYNRAEQGHALSHRQRRIVMPDSRGSDEPLLLTSLEERSSA